MFCRYHIQFFHPNLCHKCKNYEEGLKLCGNCKSVSYCCKEHQTEDWPHHKDLCKVIKTTNEQITEQEKISRLDKIGLKELRLRFIANKWEAGLKRPLFAYEWDILKFPKACTLCNCRNIKTECQDCLSVFYCSTEHKEEHAEQHEKFCSLLKLNMDLLVYKYKVKIPTVRLKESFPENLNQLYMNLPELIDILVKEDCIANLRKNERPLEYILCTDIMAPVTNILYGLEKVGFLKNRVFKKSKLTVHIVGADAEETTWDWRLMMEFMFHWIRNLKKVVLEVVGPGVHNFLCQKLDQSTFCGSCNMSLKSVCCSFRPHYYHEVIDDLSKPDLVISFNCGIFVISTWKQSIPHLTKNAGVPLVLTDLGVNLLEKDLSALKEYSTNKKLKILMGPQRNPFSYVNPKRNFDIKNQAITYKNAYILIVIPE